MPLAIGCATCLPTGVIVMGYDFRNWKLPQEFIGTLTWEWFGGQSREEAIGMFARAVIGHAAPAKLLHMDTSKTDSELLCVAQYLPTGVPALPVLGVFTAFPPAVGQLSDRERRVARLSTAMTVEQIAEELDISARTVSNIRHNIAVRLGAEVPRLDAMLAVLRDVL